VSEMALGLSDCGYRVSAVRLRLRRAGVFDCLGVVTAELDLHLAGLSLLRLGDRDLKHTAVEVSLDAVRVDAIGEGEGAGEPAERPLEAVVALVIGLSLGLALRPGRSARRT
jgi:hypothetical protein